MSQTTPTEPVNDADSSSSQTVKLSISIKLDVLRIIRLCQQQHGLRHGDYQRYRSFCSRRLRRIRKSLNATYGNQKKFQKLIITDDLVAKDIRYLLIPLICSERAWAYAMQLKSEANTEPRKKFHLLNRLRKAVKHAEQLETLCNQQKSCDARTKLEVQAYTAVMNGHLKFEIQIWTDALNFYDRGQAIYEKLKTGVRSDEDRQIIEQRIDEITTNVRFCQYKSGDKNAAKELRSRRARAALDDPETTRILDAFLSETHQQQTSSISEVTWRQRTIQVTNEKVRLFLLSLQEFEDEIKKPNVSFDSKMSLYESFLKEASETLQLLKNDPTFKPMAPGSTASARDSNEKLPDDVWIYSYIVWIRLSKMIERNSAMIDNGKQQIFKSADIDGQNSNSSTTKKVTKAADVVRMYDLLLQCLNDILMIPALNNDKIVHSDIAFQTIVYKACRSFYIAISFVQQKRFKDAAALLNKTEIYMEQAKKLAQSENQSKSNESNIQTLLNEFNFIQSQLDEVKYQIQTSASSTSPENASPRVGATALPQDENLTVEEKKELEKKPLVDRLETYFEDLTVTNKNQATLVSLPPPLQSIPCKPVLFDLALNNLTFPSLDEKVQSRRLASSTGTERTQEQQQAGVTGLFKGLFSWGGKK